ncbi:MAG: hypothetical protein M4579_006085 [Chaenotheca gracillima]|nr:MAG: hypothetical protein M4579_006085 [Chaenotheca gracillima]
MPSPAPTPSAGDAAVSHDGSPTAEAAPAETGASGASAASTSTGDGADNGLSEAKQKAKAVLTASGMAPETRSSRSGSSSSPKSSSNRKSSTTISRPRPASKELLLDQYVNRDLLQAAALMNQTTAQNDLLRSKRKEAEFYHGLRRERQMNPGAVFGYGYAGFGNGITDGKPRIVYPAQRKRPGGRKTRELRISRKEMATQADQLEELIPVRLDIDLDKLKLRDTFTWNLHDRVIPPELFAEQVVEDFRLPPDVASNLKQFVTHAISEQIQDFYPQVFIEEDALNPHLPYHAYKNDEMRILIKLNITIGQHTLVDQFEWEINNPSNSPEEFAKQMTRDLSLSGEFTTAIAHNIREQSQLFTKSLYITGHPFDGRAIEDSDLRDAFLPSPLPSVFRQSQHAKDYTPYLYELNEAELDKTEKSLSREQRRQKRSVNRRGGPALPDLKDRQRTVRTLVVSSVLPGSAETIEESRIYKRPEGVSGRSGRRAMPGQKDANEDSDSSESEESGVDSPAASIAFNAGTSRTRGMRGAASAAQAAMRANFGRSATPESMMLHHHETRISARRSGGRDREDSFGDTLIVKLKIRKERLRQFERRTKSGQSQPPEQAPPQPQPQQQPPSQLQHQPSFSSTPFAPSPSATPQQATPAPGSMGPPATTPNLHHPSIGDGGSTPQLQSANGTPAPSQPPTPQFGAVPAARPAPQGGPPVSSLPTPSPLYSQFLKLNPLSQPPTPTWLTASLNALHSAYPPDSFEGTMRWAAVNTETGASVPSQTLQQMQATNTPIPDHIQYQWLPRIRCNDCPGKLYTPGPGTTVENFEVHLKNKAHRERIEKRTGLGGGGGAGATALRAAQWG